VYEVGLATICVAIKNLAYAYEVSFVRICPYFVGHYTTLNL